jgi:hypothetical protein
MTSSEVLAHWSVRRVMTAALLAGSLIWLLVLASLLDRSSGTPMAFGIVALTLIGLTFTRAIGKLGRGQCTLTRDEVRATTARGNPSRIPLGTLTGVAVAHAAPGWAIFLWSADSNEPVRLLTPSRVFIWKATSNAAPTPDYWAKVADSPSGRAAAQIYRQALQVQPADGPLTSRPVSTLIAANRALFRGRPLRWWSPNGEHGDGPQL